ncbi:MAG TPA: response regulator transcription factor [Egibacteraceae bacterium]|nr:response regulator transcription factor [Actinomycetota bacterium]HWB71605.1 response regulator transcription factor [Egibacteraceae bacterium]
MHLLVLSDAAAGAKSLLPALELLDHTLASAPLSAEPLALPRQVDVVVVDATGDLGAASQACRLAAAAEADRPILVVVADGGLAALKASWGFDDWVLSGASPAEVETRLRLLVEAIRSDRRGRAANVGDLSIDEDTYVVRLRGRPLDLTYREFELLKHLARHPGRVFTRDHLLQEVWGYDYYGGTRTVDVHIRRLRAKLGAEHETLIATVRGVGYKLDPHGVSREQ